MDLIQKRSTSITAISEICKSSIPCYKAGLFFHFISILLLSNSFHSVDTIKILCLLSLHLSNQNLTPFHWVLMSCLSHYLRYVVNVYRYHHLVHDSSSSYWTVHYVREDKTCLVRMWLFCNCSGRTERWSSEYYVYLFFPLITLWFSIPNNEHFTYSLKHEQEVSEEELHQYLLQGVHQLEWIFSSTKAIGQQFYDGNPVWNKRMITEKEIVSDLNNNTVFVTAYSYIHDFFVQSKYDHSLINELLLWFSDLCGHCQSIDYLLFKNYIL